MKYKLICVDMDGTVLDDEKKISNENIEAMKRAHDAGVKIAICTGRLFASALAYSDILGVKAPLIASNGGYIREKDNDNVIYESYLKNEEAKDIYHIIEKYNVSMFFNTYNTVISNKEFEENYTYNKFNDNLPKEKRVKLVYPKNMDKFLEENVGEILKCICIDKDVEKLKLLRKEIESLNRFDVVSSGEFNFEIMPKGVSKGKAVKMLAAFYNIKQDEVICIGDNENDLSMIKCAGIGIAMGNAEDSIKQIADYVTDTNNNSGVAKAIDKFIFNEE
ncbi:hypothetical protein BJV85_003312 [Clostridium acetobutylicum]|uniref:Predicted hydrolase of the HAD superfamily n=1 Tax=Clostridium acetobutylicum (strain ATCC 824 / DSM 792 / JCM 1419 / IAM 19013 / LMG 5710 / NBRC 13948 / NRRL B-527 / VKM B-1787 / 2291 / W) TaxID=272562 RepID=Q97L64_CLOAB|nr:MULTISPECIES: Cof-type HAD-IIB family hydrolase [Clostridium]AAK78675.1 Predicted hydrolase of the HAD superfamily [Clostridium acetobutylicum ATCC 824]ADZ19748.1 hydrolase of the HAD superfamily [Clostridium acetobutylicum EA 2018]AEI31386.1 HAD superfamily hydrolase [Clostridium acetobutylicum DSM 1731]AWV80394.1 Cof-type HAD-IIB family hydrolase [Clostridium acetobutylicum]MBC2392583.1 Cof-type HAD-IIB family hydrolase [Clostridium acetobutylicum]